MTVSAPSKKPPYPIDRLVTGVELGEHPEWGSVELVRGKVTPVTPPKWPHGIVAMTIGTAIASFAKGKGLGKVAGCDSGIYVSRNPDTVRGPDVCFISAEKYRRSKTDGYLEVPPDLCVEVLSPGDAWSEVAEKIEEYLAFGVVLVWVVDPQRRKVHVYRKDRPIRVVAAGGKLDGEDVLPGFEMPLDEVFADIA